MWRVLQGEDRCQQDECWEEGRQIACVWNSTSQGSRGQAWVSWEGGGQVIRSSRGTGLSGAGRESLENGSPHAQVNLFWIETASK